MDAFVTSNSVYIGYWNDSQLRFQIQNHGNMLLLVNQERGVYRKMSNQDLAIWTEQW